MDEFGVRSHRFAHEATDHGYFKSQIMPVEVSLNGNSHTELFDKDEGIRANASYEATAALQPAFNPEHSITAGNSSQIADGAAAAKAPRDDVRYMTAARIGSGSAARALASRDRREAMIESRSG